MNEERVGGNLVRGAEDSPALRDIDPAEVLLEVRALFEVLRLGAVEGIDVPWPALDDDARSKGARSYGAHLRREVLRASPRTSGAGRASGGRPSWAPRGGRPDERADAPASRAPKGRGEKGTAGLRLGPSAPPKPPGGGALGPSAPPKPPGGGALGPSAPPKPPGGGALGPSVPPMAPGGGVTQRAGRRGLPSADQIAACTRCRLCKERHHALSGVGRSKAEVMFIFDVPLAEDDRAGRHLVGEPGAQLDRILKSMLGLERADVYITTVVKCRPREGGEVSEELVTACSPWVEQELRAIRPHVIVAGGPMIANYLSPDARGFESRIGVWTQWEETRVMPLYHPEALLRNRALRRAVFNAMVKIQHYLKS